MDKSLTHSNSDIKSFQYAKQIEQIKAKQINKTFI